MLKPPKAALSVAHFATLAQISHAEALSLIRAKELPSFRIGRRHFVSWQAVFGWMAQRPPPPPKQRVQAYFVPLSDLQPVSRSLLSLLQSGALPTYSTSKGLAVEAKELNAYWANWEPDCPDGAWDEGRLFEWPHDAADDFECGSGRLDL